ncbi:MAG: MFS transporter [Acidobacteria bacterium]|nr:MFS transporter [Acidobacteriota bacterium]
MHDFLELLRTNRNYRYTWLGQLVSEIGDHFNTIAVFSLILERTGSGAVVSVVMLSRAIPMMLAGPIAGVSLDRFDRRKLMLGSDLVRGLLGLLFVLTVRYEPLWPIYALSGALMFASPFFTSGRTAILPTIANAKELHTANSLTQTTKYMTVTLGTLFGGVSAAGLGYEAAFLINGFSFFFSAWMVALLKVEKGHFRPERKALTEQDMAKPWSEYRDGLRYLRSRPLLFGIALLHVGWAFGGGAAQILFSLFGEIVFDRGATGIGVIWSAAGVGLLIGASYSHWAGPKLTFKGYKRMVTAAFLLHGLAYICFSQAPAFWLACLFVGLSRTGVGLSTVLNQEQLLRHVDDAYRGRVYSTIETMTWAVMMLSLTAAGVASDAYSPRVIAAAAGCCALATGLAWAWGDWSGRLPEPEAAAFDRDSYEVRSQPRM